MLQQGTMGCERSTYAKTASLGAELADKALFWTASLHKIDT